MPHDNSAGMGGACCASIILIAFVLLCSLAGNAPAGEPALCRSDSPFTFSPGADSITLSEDGRPVFRYQYATRSLDGNWPRSNYLHPVYDLAGNVITEDFPDDHGHHRGIFWAWHQVWVGEQKAGDQWACKDFQWDVIGARSRCCTDRAELAIDVLWKSPQITDSAERMLPIVHEQTTITAYPQTEEMRIIDFRIALTAKQEGVRIGGSEDRKGYGGFSARVLLSDETNFYGPSGEVQPQTTAVAAGPWIDVASPQFGLGIVSYPGNPGFPEPWILRSQRSMQNAAYPGRQAVPLATDRATVLRYRLVIHRGSGQAPDFGRLQTQFSKNAN